MIIFKLQGNSSIIDSPVKHMPELSLFDSNLSDPSLLYSLEIEHLPLTFMVVSFEVI